MFGSNSMKSKGSPWTVNSFAKGGPRIITFSHSPFLIRPETWPQVPLPVESKATNSIALQFAFGLEFASLGVRFAWSSLRLE